MTSDSAVQLEVRTLISSYTARARRLYRVALSLRLVIVVCSFLAVLPDSSIFAVGAANEYGAITTAAGLVAALLYLFATNSRLVETMLGLNEAVAYLEDQSILLLTADGLTRQRIEIDIRKNIAAIEARLHKDVFEGLDRVVASRGAADDKQ